MELLIRGGRLVDGTRADVAIDGGVIVDMHAPRETTAGEVVDATGLVIVPGLVDAHRHVWQAALRGAGPDWALPGYLRVVLGRALAGYGPAEARLAALLGAAEALNAGITTVFDWSNTTRTPEHTDAVLQAYREAGIRAVVGHTNPDDEPDVRRLAGLTGTITGGLAVFGSDRDGWESAIPAIRRGRDLGMTVAVHAGGGPGELDRLRAAGLLGPHLQLVHVNQVTAATAALFADTGAHAVVTPVVEATMGHGPSAYTRLAVAGMRPGLGTDVMVDAPADLFETMRATLRAHRLETGTAHPAGAFLAAATVDGAAAIGLGDRVGVLAVGRRADLILLDGLAHLDGDLSGAIVTTSGPGDVHTVVVDGRIRKRAGRLVDLDLAALRRQAAPLGPR